MSKTKEILWNLQARNRCEDFFKGSRMGCAVTRFLSEELGARRGRKKSGRGERKFG